MVAEEEEELPARGAIASDAATEKKGIRLIPRRQRKWDPRGKQRASIENRKENKEQRNERIQKNQAQRSSKAQQRATLAFPLPLILSFFMVDAVAKSREVRARTREHSCLRH